MLTWNRGSQPVVRKLARYSDRAGPHDGGCDLSRIDSLMRGVRIAVTGLPVCDPIAPTRS